MRLSEQEVKKRLVRLNNLERLYPKARTRIASLGQEVKVLKATMAAQQKTIEDLKLQMEELRTIVFKRKKPPANRGNDHGNPLSPPAKPRTPDSYQRPIPKDNEVTDTHPHPINQCDCGSAISKKRMRIFYEEDIPIPVRKTITKHIVEQGYCPACQKWKSAVKLPTATLIIGPNIQKYTCYLSVMCRLSFTQIQNILQDTYHMAISQGEIANILARQADNLRPCYEQLQENIRGEPMVHLDETGWKLLAEPERSYSWVMSGGQSQESVFLIGENRGKGHADDLIGRDYDGVVVTDDYGAYRTLKKHQLCWAHLLRKFRDLANSQELPEHQIKYCNQAYRRLCRIYCLVKDNRNPERYDEFVKKLADFSRISSSDPLKMVRLKTTLAKNIPSYLTCLQDPQIPMTNNLAERSLRHLVLKRKISFGSLTKKTAENLAVLLSVLMSLKQRHQNNFFLEYLKA